ncbi:O-linked N-acetylglucosamine transferase family protein [Acidithiobacillus ferrivorans]
MVWRETLSIYQLNGHRCLPEGQSYQRADFRIAEDTIVYYCFNKNYKIAPEIYDIWMCILKRAPRRGWGSPPGHLGVRKLEGRHLSRLGVVLKQGESPPIRKGWIKAARVTPAMTAGRSDRRPFLLRKQRPLHAVAGIAVIDGVGVFLSIRPSSTIRP